MRPALLDMESPGVPAAWGRAGSSTRVSSVAANAMLNQPSTIGLLD